MKTKTGKQDEKKAIKLGNAVEILMSSKYQFLEYSDWLAVGSPEHENIVVKNKIYTKGGNKNFGKMEFFIPYLNLAIECKCQNVSGTAREKIFYTIVNLSKQPFSSILLYQGNYFDQLFVDYAQDFIDTYEPSNNKVKLMNINELLEFLKIND